MQLTTGNQNELLVRLYDSTDCKGVGRVGLRPGYLFPHLATLWTLMTPQSSYGTVPVKEGAEEKVLRLGCGPWEVLIVDAGGQELIAPENAQAGMDEPPLLAVYLLARYIGVPAQKTATSKEWTQAREHLDGISAVLPPSRCAGFTRVLLTQLNEDFERITT